jgi:hypothetical protein
MSNNQNDVFVKQEECPTCPEGTVCENSDLLCLNIPCNTTLVLLGLLRLELGPLCLKLGSTGLLADATSEEKVTQVQEILSVLKSLKA